MDWQAIAIGVCAVTVAILGWLGQRQVSRIDKLEEDGAKKADKADLTEMRKELRDDMKEHREETRTNFGRVFERLDTIVDRLP